MIGKPGVKKIRARKSLKTGGRSASTMRKAGLGAQGHSENILPRKDIGTKTPKGSKPKKVKGAAAGPVSTPMAPPKMPGAPKLRSQAIRSMPNNMVRGGSMVGKRTNANFARNAAKVGWSAPAKLTVQHGGRDTRQRAKFTTTNNASGSLNQQVVERKGAGIKSRKIVKQGRQAYGSAMKQATGQKKAVLQSRRDARVFKAAPKFSNSSSATFRPKR